jgi:osmotically-inducible protein OsmY
MKLRTTVVAGAIGAAVAFFFDPQNGKRRRKMTVGRIAAFFRRRGPKPQPDDVTLARKVETEIFRDADVPKGQINVNAENGVVYLRGEVNQPEMIEDLEEKTRNVQGVLEVENLLHVPGQEAPTKA